MPYGTCANGLITKVGTISKPYLQWVTNSVYCAYSCLALQLLGLYFTAMEEKRTGLKSVIDKEYMKMNIGETPAFSLSGPSLSVARSSIEEICSQIKKTSKDYKKLENERKILEFHK